MGHDRNHKPTMIAIAGTIKLKYCDTNDMNRFDRVN